MVRQPASNESEGSGLGLGIVPRGLHPIVRTTSSIFHFSIRILERNCIHSLRPSFVLYFEFQEPFPIMKRYLTSSFSPFLRH